MYNPYQMVPAKFKENTPAGKRYFPAFVNGRGKLMFVSRKWYMTLVKAKGSKLVAEQVAFNATTATQRAEAILVRWRQAFTDSMNAMVMESERKKQEALVSDENGIEQPVITTPIGTRIYAEGFESATLE